VVNTYDKATSTPANIYTDVSWDKGKLWALTSPVKTLGGAMPHAGTANLVALDEYMNLLDITDSTGTVLDFSKAYSASVPALSTSTAQLVLPNRFAGPIQGTVLYLSQTDFAAGGTGILSAVDLEAGTVASY
jgi:hypothetical protein